MTDHQLTFKFHMDVISWLCRFSLYSIRKIRLYLSEHAAKLLVQTFVISHVDYWNSLQVSSANFCRWSRTWRSCIWSSASLKQHISPLFISLYWPVASHIKFKTMMLAHKKAAKMTPAYLNSLYAPSRSFSSSNDRHQVLPSQQGTKLLARLFSFVFKLHSIKRAPFDLYEKQRNQLFCEHFLT